MIEKPENLPVQYARVLDSALGSWLCSNYFLSSVSSCHFWHHGTNDIYLVDSLLAKYVVRVSPSNWKGENEFAEETRLLNFLLANGLSVSEPIQSINGMYVQRIQTSSGVHFVVVFKYINGREIRHRTGDYFLIGQALAQLHLLTNEYTLPCAVGFEQEIQDISEQISYYFSKLKIDKSIFLEARDIILNTMSNLDKRYPMYGVCHGDVNFGNLIIDNNGKPTILDFDSINLGWRMLDYYEFMINIRSQNKKDKKSINKLLSAFSEGYFSLIPHEIISLSPSEFVCYLTRQLFLLKLEIRKIPYQSSLLFEEWLVSKFLDSIKITEKQFVKKSYD